MMKLVFLLALIGIAAAQRPKTTSTDSKDIQIIRSEVENNGDGSYSYRYELSDGTIVEEKGYLKPPGAGSEDPIQVAEGSYQYYSPEGELIKVDYKADENGFQPQGAHLPTPHPEIQQALEALKNAGPQGQTQSQPPRAPPQSRPPQGHQGAFGGRQRF